MWKIGIEAEKVVIARAKKGAIAAVKQVGEKVEAAAQKVKKK